MYTGDDGFRLWFSLKCIYMHIVNWSLQGLRRDGVKKNLRVTGPPTSRTFKQQQSVPAAVAATGRPQRYGHSLLEETRQANTQL